MYKNRRKPGFIEQLGTLFCRDVELFVVEKSKIFITLFFPIVIAVLIVYVTHSIFFDTYEGTKSSLFTIVSASIYIGMFNALTAICQERRIVKHEYLTGMNLWSYVFAQVLWQGVVCIVQTVVFMTYYWHHIDFPTKGIYFISTLPEYFISLFLVMYAADVTGIFISCLVKKNETANLLAPLVVICQLIFSGVLFELKGFSKKMANVMISKWGMEAMGSIARLNGLTLKIQKKYKNTGMSFPHKAENAYTAKAAHLFFDWRILLIYILILAVASVLVLFRVKKDQR
ncbi:MAG: ABC transporter permease [Eubacteriaceae bacterium]|jgi:hypothetical protein|uniref:ABC transporter permease n=1 Tax=Candidatus Pseudoramibacter fermentans TaxID=2594427 RepID=A0A6L5GQ74_9FIRM|nr:ABC transporter permease [Candidatus Pseudoramibacter fermentans]RRF92864.1 MAG: ABC transporter permease [Eubacteriaceae bacterium]